MQNEGFFTFFCCTDLAVQIGFCPFGQHLRLALRQVGAHRKGRFRQIQGMLVVAHPLCSVLSIVAWVAVAPC